MINDLVSVIMPAYNAADTIVDAIQSVVDQTHATWELLVVDDCSNDDTYSAAQNFSSKDSRISVYRLRKNGGVANARNFALERARGRYIAFLDSDDIWTCSKLELQLRTIKELNTGLCYGSYKRMSHAGNVENRVIPVPSNMSVKRLLRGNCIVMSSAIIDRHHFPQIKLRPVYFDDLVLWHEILTAGCLSVGIPEPLVYYRLTEGSISRNKFKSASEVWKIYRDQFGMKLPKSLYYFTFYSFNGIYKTWLR